MQPAVPGRGRKPKPTALKRLGGNAGKRALNKDEPTFTPLIGVACPEWLAEDQWAPTLWDMVIRELCGAEVLCVTDLHNLEAFCAAYSRWRRAEIEITKHGLVVEGATGGPVKKPRLYRGQRITQADDQLRLAAWAGPVQPLTPDRRQQETGRGGTRSQLCRDDRWQHAKVIPMST